MKKVSIEWAYNTLTISTIHEDKKEALDLFYLQEDLVDLDDKSPLTFFTHSPIPQMLIETAGENDEFTLSQNIEMTGYGTLHEYTIKNWGCPTDAIDAQFSQINEGEIRYEFRTRSCSPLKWMKELSSQYPDLMFEMESTNEFELWDEFDVVYIDGKEVVMEYKKKQR
jgi:hypothetical protein